MNLKNLFYNILFFGLMLQSYAQESSIVSADKEYDRYAYVDAITTYERVAEKGYKDEDMFKKLGNAHYFKADLKKAAQWYSELFAINKDQEAEYFYRYAQALKSVGNYKEADKMLSVFNKKSGNDQRAKLFEKNKNYLEQIKLNSGRYTIEDAGINSKFSDYGSAILQNKMIFASARDTGGVYKNIFKWTNSSFTNLYSAEIGSDGNLLKPERLDPRINSKFHESTPVYTKDGKTMYFTRNNYLDGKKRKDSKKNILLKLYKADIEDGKWKNVIELPFNSDEYSVAHPALSPDEKVLYFASDMPGTFGQSDLYKVSIDKDGSYGTPENLGNTINTEGRETFAFISEDNELYFASDGRPGLGGLDIYVVSLGGDNTVNEVQNVGAPINSPQDDFAFIINNKSRKGFFTSNREGGLGYDDIYKLTETRKLICKQILSGVITDQETGEVLTAAKVSLFDEKFQLIKEFTTTENGQYNFEVSCSNKYFVRAEKQYYVIKEEGIIMQDANGNGTLSLALEKQIKHIELGTDLAKTLEIPLIYFDLDKSNITKYAVFELEKILAVMQQYPKMKVDIRSHTDSRQTKEYNERLSDKRAKATMAWLISKGIEKERLSAKGYGESKLVNKCSDGVLCTEAEHQANRRSEFIILSIK